MIKLAVLAALFLLLTVPLFSQEETVQRGSIPQELLRPRKDEAPRYPIDTIIGELGQGQAPTEVYEVAQRTAAALLSGNADAAILSSVRKAFLEDCMGKLQVVNPRSYRLGGGREEPDGSFSFMVRFIGREEGISGELYIRMEEQRITAPQAASPPTAPETTAAATNEEEADDTKLETDPEVDSTETEAAQVAELPPPPPPVTTVRRTWHFEDLILEEPRNREVENSESRHRFDFPPYERFF